MFTFTADNSHCTVILAHVTNYSINKDRPCFSVHLVNGNSLWVPQQYALDFELAMIEYWGSK